jgi:gluconolactonase
MDLTMTVLPVTVEVRHPRFGDLIGPEAELECLISGFQFLEGPAWHPVEGHLTFSDIPANRLYRWNAVEGVSVFRQPSHMANGNTYDRQGRMLTCEHATSRVTRTEPNGSVHVIASHYQGLELNSPNDIVVKSDGCIYFTDPNFGRRPGRVGLPRPQQQPCQGVYRFDPIAQTLTRVADDFENPNGLCFSLDERRLFVNDSPRGHIRIFDVLADGGLADGRVWADLSGDGPGVPDGMKFDSEGHLFCCGPGGIHIFDGAAVCLGVIRMPEQTANFTWGDDDLRSLFITASTSLYRLRVRVPGRRPF